MEKKSLPPEDFLTGLRTKNTCRVMAIINASPESFFGPSVAASGEAVAQAVRDAEAQGADMIDLGAMSTAPYKETQIDIAEETRRMTEAVQAARAVTKLPISADTMNATVARAALAEGADIINDVSGLEHDPAMGAVIAEAHAGAILMAREQPGAPATDDEPVPHVRRRLVQCLARADAAGIGTTRVVLDPGVGFFRSQRESWEHYDVAILQHLEQFRALGYPLLVSASRKSFLGKVLGRENAEDRLAGSLAAAAWCVMHGVSIIRTHDVAATRDVVRLIEQLRSAHATHHS